VAGLRPPKVQDSINSVSNPRYKKQIPRGGIKTIFFLGAFIEQVGRKEDIKNKSRVAGLRRTRATPKMAAVAQI
jgi:hypothetical protein